MNGLSLEILAALSKEAHVGPLDSFLIAIIGIVIVFAVLIVLMFIIWLMGKIIVNTDGFAQNHPKAAEKWKDFSDTVTFKKLRAKKEGSVSAVSTDAQPEITAEKALAAGSCGELKLINTGERDAAMLMAIVADATQTPLNELRFISIKKVDGGEE